jgi:hypothetical protein
MLTCCASGPKPKTFGCGPRLDDVQKCMDGMREFVCVVKEFAAWIRCIKLCWPGYYGLNPNLEN